MIPKKTDVFKSYSPVRILTKEEYKQYLSKKRRPAFDADFIESILDTKWNNHLYRELCSKCNKPVGSHFGVTGMFCCVDNPLNPN